MGIIIWNQKLNNLKKCFGETFYSRYLKHRIHFNISLEIFFYSYAMEDRWQILWKDFWKGVKEWMSS